MATGSVLDLTSPFEEISEKIVEQQARSNPPQPENVIREQTIHKDAEQTAQQYQAAANSGALEIRRKERKYRVIRVALPSKGRFYPHGSPLHNLEIVEVRNFSSPDADTLKNPKLQRAGKQVDKLLENIILSGENTSNPTGIRPDDLLSGDREAILLALRIDAFGENYNPEIKYPCEFCGETFTPTFNMNDLDLQLPSPELMEKGGQVFELRLPVSNSLVGLRFLTNRDENEMIEYLKHTKTLDGDNPETIKRFYHLVSVDGETDRAALKEYAYTFEPRDYMTIDNFIEKNEPGIVMKQKVECSECLSSSEQRIVVNNNFFFPKTF